MCGVRNPGKLRPSYDVGAFPQMSAKEGEVSSALLRQRGPEVAAVVDAEFAHRSVYVGLDGSRGEHERFGDLGVSQPAGSELHHLCLAWGELDGVAIDPFNRERLGALLCGL